MHGELYDYQLAEYINAHSKVVITCRTHGEFLQTPYNHLKGNGCPACASSGFDKNKPAILYYLSVHEGKYYKIGITNRSVTERFSTEELKAIEIVRTWEFSEGSGAYAMEQMILEEFKEYTYKGHPVLHTGNSEIFTIDVLSLDYKEPKCTHSKLQRT